MIGAPLNPAADITLGERVWIAQHTQILKRTRIGDGSVIGAGLVVSGASRQRNCGQRAGAVIRRA